MINFVIVLNQHYVTIPEVDAISHTLTIKVVTTTIVAADYLLPTATATAIATAIAAPATTTTYYLLIVGYYHCDCYATITYYHYYCYY